MAGFVGARPGRRRLSTFLIVCQRATSRFVRITSARRGLVARAGAMRSLVRMCRFFGCAKACSIGARAAEKTRFALLCAAPLGAKGEAPTRRGADATPESPCVRRAAARRLGSFVAASEVGVLACGPPERWSAGGLQAGPPLLRYSGDYPSPGAQSARRAVRRVSLRLCGTGQSRCDPYVEVVEPEPGRHVVAHGAEDGGECHLVADARWGQQFDWPCAFGDRDTRGA